MRQLLLAVGLALPASAAMAAAADSKSKYATLLSSFVLALVLSVSVGHADATVTYSEEGKGLFSFQIPDYWSLEVDGERDLALPEVGETYRTPQVLSMKPTVDPTVWVGFISPGGVRTIDEGRAYLDDLAKFLAFDPEVDPPVSREIGGLPAVLITGTGMRDDTGLKFAIAVVQLPEERVLIAVSVVEDGSDPAFYDQLNEIYDSVRVIGH